MKTLEFIFTCMFDVEHILTPIAVEKRFNVCGVQNRNVAYVYIFGIRVAFFSLAK